MSTELRVVAGVVGFDLVGPDGGKLATRLSRQAAIARAAEVLHAGDGGGFVVVGRNGVAGAPTMVEGAHAVGGTRQPEPAAGRKVPEAAQKVAEAAAKVVDDALDRHEPAPALPGQIDGLRIDRVVPAGVLNRPAVRDLNTHVGVGAAWIALVGFTLGGGTAGALLTALVRAWEGTTTVGTYMTVGTSFFSSAALCLSVGWATWAVLQGELSSHGALAAWVVGSLVVSAMLRTAGLAGPSGEDVLQSISDAGSTPFAWVVGLFSAFFSSYGAVTFASGAGIGFLGGRYAHRRSLAGAA